MLQFLIPLIAGGGAAAGGALGALGTAGSILGTVGSAGLGIGGAIGSAALGGVGGIGGAIGSAALGAGGILGSIPSLIGGLGNLATIAKPVSDLFGAGYGVYSSVEQLKAQKEAQKKAKKESVRLAQIAQEQLRQPIVESPMKTYANLIPMPSAPWPEQPAPVAGPVTEKAAGGLPEYLPLVLLAILAVLLMTGKRR